MATATAYEQVTTTLDTLTISLTPQETDALLAVIANVGGSPTRSRRGDIDAIRDAIKNACPDYFSEVYCRSNVHAEAKGTVYFDDRP